MGRDNNQKDKCHKKSVEKEGKASATPPSQPISHGKGHTPNKANVPSNKEKTNADPEDKKKKKEHKNLANTTPAQMGGADAGQSIKANAGKLKSD